MKIAVTRIGNSRGIRIPKPILEQVHIKDEVDLEVVDGQLILRSITTPRKQWGESFQKMRKHGDDLLLDSDSSSQWDKAQWEW